MASTQPGQITRKRAPKRPTLLHSTTVPSVSPSTPVTFEDVYHDTSARSTAVALPLRFLSRRMTEPVSVVKKDEATPIVAVEPSYWTDHAHLATMLKIWDAMRLVQDSDVTDGRTATQAKIDATKRRMLRRFGELGHGKTALSTEWISYVLGKNLRLQPEAAPSQSRWAELGLAAASGLSKGWGPW